MAWQKDELIYANLKALREVNRLTIRDLSVYLGIPYETLISLCKRRTRINERYGARISKALGFSYEQLFLQIMDNDNLHMYFNLQHYQKIIDEYYDSRPLGRIDYRASALHTICRLIGNSPIRLYIGSAGMALIDERSIRDSYPVRQESASTSLIVLDSSVSVKDYDAASRSLKGKQEAYEKEIELIRYLKDRINAFFPCSKPDLRYKKIFLYNMVYRQSHRQIKERFDYDQGYQQFLKDKKIAEEIAYVCFGLLEYEDICRFLDQLIIKDAQGNELKDYERKLSLYRKENEDD